jgi:hypothetical protein
MFKILGACALYDAIWSEKLLILISPVFVYKLVRKNFTDHTFLKCVISILWEIHDYPHLKQKVDPRVQLLHVDLLELKFTDFRT